MYNSCISRELTSIYTDFNLLIELQYELEWILYLYSCSISLRNSLGNFSSRTKLVQMVLIISFDDQPPIVPTIWLITDQIWCSFILFGSKYLTACEQKCKFVLGHYEVLFFKYFIFVRNSIGFAKMV